MRGDKPLKAFWIEKSVEKYKYDTNLTLSSQNQLCPLLQSNLEASARRTTRLTNDFGEAADGRWPSTGHVVPPAASQQLSALLRGEYAPSLILMVAVASSCINKIEPGRMSDARAA